MSQFKNYRFKLEKSAKNKQLHSLINAAGLLYNHCIMLHKRYYRLFGKKYRTFLDAKKLSSHIVKLRKLKKFEYITKLYAQSCCNIAYNIEKGYFDFFENLKKKVRTGSPNFKKLSEYNSVSLYQNGYEFLYGNRVRIHDNVYKYIKTCEMEGKVKKLIVNRNDKGDIYINVLCEMD